MKNEKILVAGATGQVAFPMAKTLAADNEVWALARFNDDKARASLEGAGVHCHRVDLVDPDLSGLPDDFAYVLNFAVPKSGDWSADLDAAGAVATLMEHCQAARAFLHCSSTAVYQPAPEAVFTEDDALGDNHRIFALFMPFMETYSIGKITAEAFARWGARRWQLPTTIARLSVPYGDNGGWPAIHLDMMAAGMAVAVHPKQPNRFNPIHEDDIVRSLDGLLAAATVPAVTVNWGGEASSIEEWCRILGELTGLEPTFEVTEQTISSVCVDTTRLRGMVGELEVPLREGLARMVAARRPDLSKP